MGIKGWHIAVGVGAAAVGIVLLDRFASGAWLWERLSPKPTLVRITKPVQKLESVQKFEPYTTYPEELAEWKRQKPTTRYTVSSY